MTKKMQIYTCEFCGNVIEIVRKGEGGRVCCETSIKLLPESTVAAAIKKHSPVSSKVEAGGNSVVTPVEEKYHTDWLFSRICG